MNDELRIWRTIAHVALAGLAFLGLMSVMDFIRDKVDFSAKPETPKEASFKVVTWNDLPEWQSDDHAAALSAFVLSCEKLEPRHDEAPFHHAATGNIISQAYGLVSDWRTPCAEAATINDDANAAQKAQNFFEANFTPLFIHQPQEDNATKKETDGLFTGYFEPIYHASKAPTEDHNVPVLTKPEDLISVDLGAFREDLKGKKIAGRISGSSLKPYGDHRDIIEQNVGKTINAATPLAWMNPNDLLFLQIQGSGKLQIGDTVKRIGYAAQNGHKYVPVGATLHKEHGMPIEDISMQSIYQWLETATPEDAASVRYSNPSYVFFRELNDLPYPALGPLGAQSVQLTAGRSLAVDDDYHGYGAPIWLDIKSLEENNNQPFRRLMIAQDTGGAINGAVRGDVYWGSGDAAGAKAGTQNATGRFFVLVPKSALARQKANGAP